MYITFLTVCSLFVSLPMSPFPPQAEEGSEIWRNYVEYLDDIVLDGFFNCIHCSLIPAGQHQQGEDGHADGGKV